MGIAEKIKNAIWSELVIRYQGEDELKKRDRTCVLCHMPFKAENFLCIYVKDEGYVCKKCGERFAPEMMNVIEECNRNRVEGIFDKRKNVLSVSEWNEVRDNINALHKISVELARTISQGIIEEPSGYVGLIHYAKDIEKPHRKDNESDNDYEMRVKSHRMITLFDRIKKETCERISILESYLTKLGMPKVSE